MSGGYLPVALLALYTEILPFTGRCSWWGQTFFLRRL